MHCVLIAELSCDELQNRLRDCVENGFPVVWVEVFEFNLVQVTVDSQQRLVGKHKLSAGAVVLSQRLE